MMAIEATEHDSRLHELVWHAIRKHDEAIDQHALRRCVPAFTELIRSAEQHPVDPDSVRRILQDLDQPALWVLGPELFERQVAHITERLNRFRHGTRFELQTDSAGSANWIG